MKVRRIHVYPSVVLVLGLTVWLTDRHLRENRSSLAEKMIEAKQWLASKTPESAALRKSRQRWKDDRTAMLKQAKEWSERLASTRPELQIQYREVPDEKNGLLQLLEWAKTTTLKPEVDTQAFELVTEEEHWDAAKAEALVAENAETLAKLEAIGMLQDTSCKGVDRLLIAGKTREIEGAMKLMTLQIRLAGEHGDFVTAQRKADALYGLGRHLGNTEAPCSLDFVVAAGMSAQSGGMLQRLIAKAKTPEELDHWRTLLPSGVPLAPTNLLRGDWDAAAASIYLPAILGDDSQGFRDTVELTRAPEATGEAFANLYAAGIREAQGRTPQQWMELPDMAFIPPYQCSAEVPEKARKIIEDSATLQIKIQRSALLYQRKQVLRQAAAALALGEQPPSDPLTGEAFLYDEKTRTLSVPGEPNPETEPVQVVKLEEQGQ